MKDNDLELFLAVAKVDITPKTSLPLAGFAHRTGHFEAVVRPLYARLFLFEQAGQRSLLVTADLIWWGQKVVDSLRRSIQEDWGIPPERILLHATHNHSGPQTSTDLAPSLGRCDADYVQWLQTRIADGLRYCVGQFEPVRLEKGVGAWSEGINRRKLVDGVCEMAPNPQGPNNQAVTVLRFRTNCGETKALLIHATCHPTTVDANAISSEFPGYAMELVERDCDAMNRSSSNQIDRSGPASTAAAAESRHVVAGFLQGFCGDVRPALIREGDFFKGTDDDVQRLGQVLADETRRVLETGMNPVSIRPMTCLATTVDLPLSPLPSTEELHQALQSEDDAVAEWARILLENPTYLRETIPLELTYFSLAARFALLTANAEMVVEYGDVARARFGNDLLPIGYTNGIVGYVPTSRQLVEGGYEPLESVRYFLLPAAFSCAVETDIRHAVTQLRGEVEGFDAQSNRTHES